jgi:LPS-assembly protein
LIKLRPIFILIIACLLLSPLLPLSGGAEGQTFLQPSKSEKEEGKGRIEADRLDFLEGGRIIEATGNVNISYSEFWIRADRVRYERETEEVLAEGAVFLTDGKSRLEGTRLEYNSGTGQGTLYQGNGFLSPTLWVTGMEIKRQDENTYYLSQATVTPCPREGEGSPDWEIRAQKATIHLDATAVAKGASFWVKGIPLLYSPLLAVPAGERQSGFLIPQTGYSTREGFILKNAYFWAISPSQDATFSLNYRSKRGLEEGLEYRYILSPKARGQFDGTYTYDRLRKENRWKVTYRHQQEIQPDLNAKLNLNLQNTRNYQRIYNPDTEVRSQRLQTSEGYVTQNWSNESLMLWGHYAKDLRQPEYLYRLPELSFLSFRQPWESIPLYFHLNSSAAYFESGFGSKGESGRVLNLGRFDLYPRLTLPLSLGGVDSLTPLVAFRETLYTRDREEDRAFGREVYQLQARLDSHLSRTFEAGGETLKGIHHIIEPMVAYEYIPEVDQSDLRHNDELDFLSPQNGITYSLTNRLWAKFREGEGSRIQEIFILRLSQSYNIHGPHQGYPNPELGVAYNELRSGLGLRFSERRFSDINAHLGLNPVKFLNLALDANYDPGGNHIDTLDPYLGLQLPHNVSLTTGYHYAPELKVNAFHGRCDLKLGEWAALSYYTRYNFERSTFLENKIMVTYFGPCWSVTFGYIRRPDQNDFRFSFDLRTISGVK